MLQHNYLPLSDVLASYLDLREVTALTNEINAKVVEQCRS